MKTYKRDSVFIELNGYDMFSNEGDFMEITEWHNGEGKDVVINSKNGGEQTFSLTYGAFEALLVAWNYKGE